MYNIIYINPQEIIILVPPPGHSCLYYVTIHIIYIVVVVVVWKTEEGAMYVVFCLCDVWMYWTVYISMYVSSM